MVINKKMSNIYILKRHYKEIEKSILHKRMMVKKKKNIYIYIYIYIYICILFYRLPFLIKFFVIVFLGTVFVGSVFVTSIILSRMITELRMILSKYLPFSQYVY